MLKPLPKLPKNYSWLVEQNMYGEPLLSILHIGLFSTKAIETEVIDRDSYDEQVDKMLGRLDRHLGADSLYIELAMLVEQANK